MEEKPQKRLKEVNADKKGRLIQAVAHYCGISSRLWDFTDRKQYHDRANPQE